MRKFRLFLVIIGAWLIATDVGDALQQASTPGGFNGGGGLGFTCDAHQDPMKCTCTTIIDCDAMAASNVCEQVVVVVDGEEWSVDAMDCGIGEPHPQFRHCTCNAPLRSDPQFWDLYPYTPAARNSPRSDDVLAPSGNSSGRPSETVPARRGAPRVERAVDEPAERSRRTRDHRDDN